MPTRRSSPPAELADYSPQRSEVRVIYRAELRCYHCGSTCGTFVSPDPYTIPPVVNFRPLGSDHETAVEWRRLRCARCQGPTFVDEVERVVERIDRPNWALDRPRRGRPPKWLVELRALDAA
jgi:hypothetical protein